MRIEFTFNYRTLITSFALLMLLAGCDGGGSTAPALAPSALSYTSPQTYTDGTAITALNARITGTVTNYSVSPALPSGLMLNTVNGQITGTPTAETTTANYTITALNSGGSTNFALSITVSPPASTVDLQVATSGVLDPEFDMYSNRYTYCEQNVTQSIGRLWVGTFNADGSFDDYNAHPGTSLDSCLFQINGPEWGRDNSGAVISYVKNDAMGNPTLAYVHEDSPNNWNVHIVPNLPALTASYNAVYPSDTPSNTARVLFVAADGIEWRDLGGGAVPGIGGNLASTEQGFPRWATQSNYIALIESEGMGNSTVKQLVAYNTDDGSSVKVSSSTGDKNNPHMWVDANWGMVVAGAVGSNYEVWQLSTQTLMVSIPSPNGMPMQSPEHFVYQGHSYIYYFVQNDAVDGTKNNDVYVTSIETSYNHLKVSGSQLMTRIEPEVAFPTNSTPIIFFSAKGSDGKNNALWRSAMIALPQL